MNDHEKSHAVVVPAKPGNKGAEAKAKATADSVEGRTATKRNSTKGDTCRTQSRESVPHALGRVRQVGTTPQLKVRPDAVVPHVRVCAGGTR